MLIKVMAWLLACTAAFFALAGAAPFSGGALFPVCSLPVAACIAWRGPRVAPLLVLGCSGIGFWIAVIPREEIFSGWLLPAWLCVWTAVLLVGVLRRRSAVRQG
jgi:hypothetical protein